jgi:hypothetical protein
VRWSEDHDKAKALISAGIAAQRRLAHDLVDVGLTVRLPLSAFVEPVDGPNINSVRRFADVADILIGPGLKIETKERSFEFTGPEDFPYDTCMMGDRRSWVALRHPPVATVVLSKSGGRMVVPTPSVLVNRIPLGWSCEENYDSQRDIVVDSVLAPRSFYRAWDVFIEWAKEQEVDA